MSPLPEPVSAWAADLWGALLPQVVRPPWGGQEHQTTMWALRTDCLQLIWRPLSAPKLVLDGKLISIASHDIEHRTAWYPADAWPCVVGRPIDAEAPLHDH
eukprot:5010759-Pyramimonas_sp.AAC.1